MASIISMLWQVLPKQKIVHAPCLRSLQGSLPEPAAAQSGWG
jgi:hypothetical protein